MILQTAKQLWQLDEEILKNSSNELIFDKLFNRFSLYKRNYVTNSS